MKKIFIFILCTFFCVSSCSKEKENDLKERYDNVYAYVVEKERNLIIDISIKELDLSIKEEDKIIYYYRVFMVLTEYFHEYVCYYEYIDYLNGNFSIKLLKNELIS